MAFVLFPAKEADDGVHVTQETRQVWPVDVRLRANGFEIWARPKDGEPVWIKGNIKFRESEAILRLPTP